MSKTLDWRELAPPQETHECDCDYCDQSGDLEPIRWPTLIPVTVGGVEYVTDRFIMVRADVAPIPDDYEGAVLALTVRKHDGFMAAAASNVPATGKLFRWHILKAVELTGWRLRLLTGSDACAVVTAEGEHIGWAMPGMYAVNSEWSNGFTREYSGEQP